MKKANAKSSGGAATRGRDAASGGGERARLRAAEAELQRKTEELDRYFAKSLDLLCIADTHGYFRRLNPQWERTLGYAVAELEGTKFLDLVHPDDVAATTAAVAQLRAQREVLNFTNRYRCKDGAYRWIEWRSYPDGELIYADARDVTARLTAERIVQAERDLHVQLGRAATLEEALHACLHAALAASGMERGGVYLARPDGGLELLAHQGLSPEFVTATAHYDRASENAAMVYAGKPRYVATRETSLTPDRLQIPDQPAVVAVVPILHQGKVVACLNAASSALVEIGPEARRALESIASRVGLSIARIQAEEARRDSEQRIRLIGDNLPTGSMVYQILVAPDGTRRFSYVSAGVTAAHGVAPEAVYADPLTLYGQIHEEDAARLAQAEEAALAAHATFSIEVRFRTPRGERWSLLRSAPRPLPDGSLLWDGVETDITEQKRTEARLRESEERNRLISELMTDYIFVVDVAASGGPAVRWLSSSYAAQTGRTADQATTVEQWRGLIHPEDHEAFFSFMEATIRGGEPGELECRSIARPGGPHWIRVSCKPQRDATGRVAAVLGAVKDITERKLAEQAQLESERRFRLLLQNSNDITTVMDASGQQVLISGPLERILGYRPEELLGTSGFDLVHPDDIPGALKAFTEGAATPGAVGRFEYRYRHKNGRWVELEAVGVNLLEDPTVRGVVLNIRDITERKRAEHTLRGSEERYRLFSELSGQLIYDYNVRTGEIQWAGRVEEITGFSPAEFDRLGIRGWEELIHPDDRATASQELADAMDAGRAYSYRYRFRKRSGEYIHVADDGVFVRDEAGQAVRMIGAMKDETERHAAERERARLQEQLQQAMKMEAVGRLAGGIAHDFNNLLTAIAGNVELAKMDLAAADPLVSRLNEVNKAAESAAALTRSLLAFSRKQIIEPRTLNLNELIGNLHKMLGRLIGEDIHLKTLPGDGVGSVRVDPGQFEQVLVNLAVNARDAMPDGGSLTIATTNAELGADDCRRRPDLRPGPYVLLTVSDTGHGMDEEVKQRLFEPFFTTKPLGRGTGLGLATSFGVVKQAGGAIEADSEVGVGTTFRIYLPRCEAAAEDAVARPRNELPGGAETVLLVEDEELVRELALRVLKRLGYDVLPAQNGGEAFMLAERRRDRIDLMVTDVVMPGINGRELAERLAALHPEMKVLFTSGYTEDVVVHHGVVDRQMNFLGKPYTPTTLAQKIRAVLDADDR